MAGSSSYQDDELRERLRQKLNADQIKLWLQPYTSEDGQKGEEPTESIEKYSKELDVNKEKVHEILEELRQHALQKLAAKNRFQNHGIASLKVKLAGNVPDQFKQENPGLTVELEISLTVAGHKLKTELSQKSSIEPEKLKLIAGGKVIEDERSLQEQGIRNMASLMCLVLSESEAEMRKQEERTAKVEKTRKAAEYLSSYTREDDDNAGDYYLQIADQSGKPIDLPNEERKALTLAMTLHEKGRAAVKRKNYGEAVLLLLEADEEFKKCRADILNAVDNYALVCLDIVWCYLCLKNVDGLPDAEIRLKACDDCLRKSYGANLERLALVKGETGEERALFLRLHLLQGILAYHQHRSHQARDLLNRAKYELGVLTVDEDKMTQVMEMGFSQQEARLALRASDGNVQAAIMHIMRRREEKAQIQEKEKEEKRRKRISKKLGKTGNGQEVNVGHYESLVGMGFGKGAAADALRQADNDIMAALQILQEHPELLNLPDPDPPEVKITDEMLSQVTAMGFDVAQARAALNHYHGNIETCVQNLLQLGGVVPQAWLDAVAAAVSSAGASGSAGNSSPTKSPEEAALKQEALDNIVPDLGRGEEDHLDLDLNDEATFLQQYLSLLES